MYKNTFLRSSSLSTSGLSYVTNPLLLVDMKSLRTEAGFERNNQSNFLQHVYQRAAALWYFFITKQGSRGGRRDTVYPCVSSSVMAIVCHFPGITEKWKQDVNRNRMKDVSGERSPLVQSIQLILAQLIRNKDDRTITWLLISYPFKSLKAVTAAAAAA